jgi:hypothetical protein
MTATTTTNSTDNRTATISVDLVAAAHKSEDGFFSRLPDAEIVEAAARYEKFLTLVQRYPDTLVSPSRDIDEMWHLHMLHPVAYYHDCMTNFGEILDHDGGFGSASEEEWGELISIFEATAVLWQREFGEEYAPADARVKATKCAKACAKCAVKCRTACKK